MRGESAGCIKHLHCETGKSEIQTKMRASILATDVDMDPDLIAAAMKQAEADGLTGEVPAHALGQIPDAADSDDAKVAMASSTQLTLDSFAKCASKSASSDVSKGASNEASRRGSKRLKVKTEPAD